MGHHYTLTACFSWNLCNLPKYIYESNEWYVVMLESVSSGRYLVGLVSNWSSDALFSSFSLSDVDGMYDGMMECWMVSVWEIDGGVCMYVYLLSFLVFLFFGGFFFWFFGRAREMNDLGITSWVFFI